MTTAAAAVAPPVVASRAVLAGASSADPTVRCGPAVLAVVVVAALGVSRVLDGLPLRAAVRALLIIGCSLAVPLLVLLVHNPSRKDVPR
jgi:hypothetical protein